MFSILSWNIQYGKGTDGIISLERIAEEIHKIGLPDVLCLQEVSRNDPKIDKANDQFSILKSMFPKYNHFFGPSYDRLVEDKKKRKQFGNIVFSNRSPVQVIHHMLPSPADPKARFMPRQVTEMVINTGSITFRLMNTHLEFFSEKQQIAQVYKLRNLHKEACFQYQKPGINKPNSPFEIVEKNENMIICGDFNFTVKSIPYKMILKPMPGNISDIVDAWKVIYPKNNHTPTCGLYDQKQWKQGPHCRDYFFLSKILEKKVKKLSVYTETSASDHQPILLELDL